VTPPPASTPHTLADRIRALPRALGVTQAALAERAGMGPSQLSALLRRLDARPLAIELETVARLAEAGGVSAFWLLFGEAAPEAGRLSPLRLRGEFARALSALKHRGYHLPDELMAWLGEIVLPLDAPGQLTPEVLAALVTLRIQMRYGPGALGPHAAPYAFSPFPPQPSRSPQATAGPSPTHKRTRKGYEGRPRAAQHEGVGARPHEARAGPRRAGQGPGAQGRSRHAVDVQDHVVIPLRDDEAILVSGART
jgi:transcriptional regulator with XRE-family HTH domain